MRLAHVGVEAVARDVHERREEPSITVATQEQLAAPAILQAEDAHAGLQQFLGTGLEQFIARQGFDDVSQRLAVVAVRTETRALHDLLMALPHDRDIPRAAVVRTGGVQAEEALFDDRLAMGVVHQHADVIHVAGAVHGRARIGLGQDQRLVRAVGLVGCETGDRTRLRITDIAAQQAQAAAVDRHQHFALALLDDPILAIAEEGEMILCRPAQEGTDLAALVIVDRQRARRQLVGDLYHLVAHRRPILDACAHVGKHREHLRLHVLERAGIRQAFDFQVDDRLGPALAHAGELAAAVARDQMAPDASASTPSARRASSPG